MTLGCVPQPAGPLADAWRVLRWLATGAVAVLSDPSVLASQAVSANWSIVDSAVLDAPLVTAAADLAIGPDGKIYILDGINRTVVQIALPLASSRKAVFMAISETASPLALDFDRQGRLTVFDPELASLFIYDLVGDRLRLQKRLDLPDGTTRICLCGDSVVAMGSNPSGLIHILSADGRTIGNAGRPFGRGELPEIAASSASSGPLLCLRAGGEVVAASSLLGELRRYSLNGTLIWRVRLNTYRAPVVNTDGSTFASFSLRPGGTHSIVSIVKVPGARLLVQLSLTTDRRLPGHRQPVETRELDEHTGEQSAEPTLSMPLLQREWRGRYFGAGTAGGRLRVYEVVNRNRRGGAV